MEKFNKIQNEKEFLRAMKFGFGGRIHLNDDCRPFYLTRENCYDNGWLDRDVLMLPYAFVLEFPEDKKPYIITICKRGDGDFYEEGQPYVFRVDGSFKDNNFKLRSVNDITTSKIADYTRKNHYWTESTTESSR